MTIVEREWRDRRYRVHVPARYRSSEPASLMVFQDGWLYLDPEGEIRAGLVLDDLIDRGEMPVSLNWGPGRNWLSENLGVAVALSHRGYDFRLVVGEGGHEPSHTGSILPDALPWLWRR